MNNHLFTLSFIFILVGVVVARTNKMLNELPKIAFNRLLVTVVVAVFKKSLISFTANIYASPNSRDRECQNRDFLSCHSLLQVLLRVFCNLNRIVAFLMKIDIFRITFKN